MIFSVPNVISLSRIAAAPLLVAAAALERSGMFLVLFAVSLASDFADGLLARLLRSQSALGAKLDTCGDASMYLCAAIGGALLWPDLIRNEALYIFAALALIGVSALASLLRHGRLPSYHTWSTKLASALIGATALVMFMGFPAWPFRLAVVMLAVAVVEEIAITFILPRWRPNVANVAQAVRLRREEGFGGHIRENG